MGFSITASDPALVRAVPRCTMPALPSKMQHGQVQNHSFRQASPEPHELVSLQWSSPQRHICLCITMARGPCLKWSTMPAVRANACRCSCPSNRRDAKPPAPSHAPYSACPESAAAPCCTNSECFCVLTQVREYMNRVVRAESEASRAKAEAVRVSEALQCADQDIQASAEQSSVPI